MTKYRDIDANEYFYERRDKAQWWKKDATVKAREAEEGEKITTVAGGIEETTNVAKKGDMIVRNPDGEQYIISKDKFKERYKETDSKKDFDGYREYNTTGTPMPCIRLTENVKFVAPWGEPMKIQSKGMLVYNGPDDVYGIQPTEFENTYVRCKKDGTLIASSEWEKAFRKAEKEAKLDEELFGVKVPLGIIEINALKNIDPDCVGLSNNDAQKLSKS